MRPKCLGKIPSKACWIGMRRYCTVWRAHFILQCPCLSTAMKLVPLDITHGEPRLEHTTPCAVRVGGALHCSTLALETRWTWWRGASVPLVYASRRHLQVKAMQCAINTPYGTILNDRVRKRRGKTYRKGLPWTAPAIHKIRHQLSAFRSLQSVWSNRPRCAC